MHRDVRHQYGREVIGGDGMRQQTFLHRMDEKVAYMDEKATHMDGNVW